MAQLTNKVAIVTGAARGIGEAIAKTLAQAGAKVALVDINMGLLKQVETQIKSTGADAMKIGCDVSNFKEVETLVKTVINKWNKIDILVNNAGINRDALILRLDESDWDKVIAVNLKGTFNCIKAVSKFMVKQKSGKIINITSVIGLIGNVGQANYAASKAGIIGLTKSAAREFAARGITANAIAPGFIETPMTQQLPNERREQMLNQIPLKRVGSPEEVAKLVLFLASDDANYITGQVINIDGGMVM